MSKRRAEAIEREVEAIAAKVEAGAWKFPEAPPSGPVQVEDAIAALMQTGGAVAKAAELLRVGRTNLYRFIDRHPEVREWLDEYREGMVDAAEGTVFRLAREGNLSAAKFILRTLGRGRGYGASVEVRGPEGRPVPVAALPPGVTVEEAAELYAKVRRGEATYAPEGSGPLPWSDNFGRGVTPPPARPSSRSSPSRSGRPAPRGRPKGRKRGQGSP